ncbi:hypothetical protein F5Y17DRAFT_426424 [Xylariaceae sp. FL0594]|nr:hypothetical protein F5Y17DRAFT_426424 [Xylariaceae sp. FL0594]
MSFFSGTSKIVNTSTIPAVVSKEDAVALLHDHDFFLHCDPHYAGHKRVPPPASLAPQNDVDAARKHYKLPANLTPLLHEKGEKGGEVVVVKVYEVTDHMPNPVWNSNVVSTEEFVDTAEGMWCRIRSPMGVVMETFWVIRPKQGTAGELELVEDVSISASRLVLGIVKGQVENNWRAIHKQFVDKLVADAEEARSASASASGGK